MKCRQCGKYLGHTYSKLCPECRKKDNMTTNERIDYEWQQLSEKEKLRLMMKFTDKQMQRWNK